MAPPSDNDIQALVMVASRTMWDAVLEHDAGATSAWEELRLDSGRRARRRRFKLDARIVHLAAVLIDDPTEGQRAVAAIGVAAQLRPARILVAGLSEARPATAVVGDVVIATDLLAVQLGMTGRRASVLTMYDAPSGWADAATSFGQSWREGLATRFHRPPTLDQQAEWLLQSFAEYEAKEQVHPAERPDRAGACPQWDAAIAYLRHHRWMHKTRFTLNNGGRVRVTELAGSEHATANGTPDVRLGRVLSVQGRRLTEDAFQTAVEATGPALANDDEGWSTLVGAVQKDYDTVALTGVARYVGDDKRSRPIERRVAAGTVDFLVGFLARRFGVKATEAGEPGLLYGIRPTRAPKAGQQLGPWTLSEDSERGGYGRVFKAADRDGNVAAVKVFLPRTLEESEAAARRFRRGPRALRLLEAAGGHPSIVRLIEGPHLDNQALWYAMHFVEGGNLQQRRRVLADLGLAVQLRCFAQVVDAIYYAHNGLPSGPLHHRDISPQNVLITRRSDRWQAVVVDFDLAHHTQFTSMSWQAGAPGRRDYIPPEQRDTERPVGYYDYQRPSGEMRDIWALGVLLHFLLTGSQSLVDPLLEVKQRHEKALRHVPPRLAKELEKLCAALTAREPSRRPVSVRQLRAQLAPILRRLEIAPPWHRPEPEAVPRPVSVEEIHSALPKVLQPDAQPDAVDIIDTAVAPPPIDTPPARPRKTRASRNASAAGTHTARPPGPAAPSSQAPTGRVEIPGKVSGTTRIRLDISSSKSSDSKSKVLRIGLIENGRILEERIFRQKERISIGSGMNNTFLAAIGVRKHVLFIPDGAGHLLRLLPGMTGKFEAGDRLVQVEDLRRRHNVPANHIMQVTVGPSSRGKLVAGDVTLLFQHITPPPRPAGIRLPASSRGGALDQVNRFFAALLVVLSALFGGGAGWADHWWRNTGVQQAQTMRPAGFGPAFLRMQWSVRYDRNNDRYVERPAASVPEWTEPRHPHALPQEVEQKTPVPPAPIAPCVDQDDDGVCQDHDCDDSDPFVKPGAPELADGLDNNCDGNVDEGRATRIVQQGSTDKHSGVYTLKYVAESNADGETTGVEFTIYRQKGLCGAGAGAGLACTQNKSATEVTFPNGTTLLALRTCQRSREFVDNRLTWNLEIEADPRNVLLGDANGQCERLGWVVAPEQPQPAHMVPVYRHSGRGALTKYTGQATDESPLYTDHNLAFFALDIK